MNIRGNKGFTLIEMIIVMVLIGIVSAIASTSFISYRDNTNFRETAQDFASDIAFWKQRAVAENIRYQIVLDINNNNYTVQREDPASPGNFIALVPAVIRSFGERNTRVSIFANNFPGNNIRINTRGTVSAGTATLVHADLAGRTANIITSTMGRIRVEYGST